MMGKGGKEIIRVERKRKRGGRTRQGEWWGGNHRGGPGWGYKEKSVPVTGFMRLSGKQCFGKSKEKIHTELQALSGGGGKRISLHEMEGGGRIMGRERQVLSFRNKQPTRGVKGM